MAPFAQERTVALKPRLFVRPTIEPPGSSGSARRPAQPTPDFAQSVAPREKAIAASLALSVAVESSHPRDASAALNDSG